MRIFFNAGLHGAKIMQKTSHDNYDWYVEQEIWYPVVPLTRPLPPTANSLIRPEFIST